MRHHQGRLIGRMEGLGSQLRIEAVLQSLTEEILKSNEIEGEVLDREQVRSSIARRLGMDIGALAPVDRNVEGVVEMMLDTTRNYAAPLTKARLFDWHAALFATGRRGMTKIRVGAWRDGGSGPMQLSSGPVGRERVHYEAPAAPLLEREMRVFKSARAGCLPLLIMLCGWSRASSLRGTTYFLTTTSFLATTPLRCWGQKPGLSAKSRI